MPSKVPCIAAIVKASKDRLTNRAAGEMLRKLGDLADMRSQTKRISLDAAAAEIHAEAIQRENFRAAKARLSAMMDMVKEGDLYRTTNRNSTKKKYLADALIEQFDFILKDEKITVETQMNSVHAAIDKAGLTETYANLGVDGFGKDFLFAMHDLQNKRPIDPSLHKGASKIAEIVHAKMLELGAYGNSQGADIRFAPGYGLKQVHDIVSLVRKFGIDQKEKARLHWRGIIDKKNIDWERTLTGAATLDKDKFLNEFFYNIWDSVHPVEDNKSAAFLPGGNLAHRASAERVLWFQDAESDWNYRLEMSPYGGDMAHAAEAQIRGMVRNNNMLKHLGTRPDMLVENVLKKMKQDIHNSPAQDSAAQIKALDSARVKASSIVLSGRHDIVENQRAADIVDFLKYWVGYLPKMGGASITALFTDGVGMRTQMVHEGATHLEAFMSVWSALLPKTDQDKAIIASIGDQAEAWIDAQQMSWRDSKGSYGKKAMTLMMKWTWMTKITKLHRDVMTLWKVYDWGKHSDVEFSKLDVQRKRNLEKFDIGADEWNLVRQHPAQGTKKAITPDTVYQIPDAEIDKLTGVSSPESRKAWREKLETKLYIALRNTVDTGMNQPGLAEHILFSGYGATKGSGIRNGLDLITPLKGFAFSSWNRTADRSREAGGWQTKEAISQVAFQVAQGIVAGYVALTAKDLLSGRHRRQLIDEDGMPNLSVVAAAGLRGGALGIYGDFLFAEYDRRYKSYLGAAAGPVIGQLDPAMALVTSLKDVADGDVDKNMTQLGDDAFKLVQNNIPFNNVFYLKPLLDHMVWWHIRESLSPGVFRRSEKSIEKQNFQGTWIQPTDGFWPTAQPWEALENTFTPQE